MLQQKEYKQKSADMLLSNEDKQKKADILLSNEVEQNAADALLINEAKQNKTAILPSKEDMNRALALRHGNEIQQSFANATVAVCGLGGLGSNIAIALARAGIGKLILIDFDKVDITNLHRQQYKACQIGRTKAEAIAENLGEMAPYITLDVRCQKVTEDNVYELLHEADIICEAFDKAEEKAMLVNAVLERLPDKYLVAASGMAGLGLPDAIKTRKVTKKFYLCGDGISDIADGEGLFSTRVMLCAAHQAHTVLRILAGEEER